MCGGNKKQSIILKKKKKPEISTLVQFDCIKELLFLSVMMVLWFCLPKSRYLLQILIETFINDKMSLASK